MSQSVCDKGIALILGSDSEYMTTPAGHCAGKNRSVSWSRRDSSVSSLALMRDIV